MKGTLFENDLKLLIYTDDQATNRNVAPILSGFHGHAHRFCHEFNEPTLMIKHDNGIYLHAATRNSTSKEK
jgi:hypothetical protein